MYFHFPNFNPIIFSIGSISAHWYGFMYMISLMFALWYGNYKNVIYPNLWKYQELEILLYSLFIGACIGGRIGYIIFYNFTYFSHNMLSIFKIWEGGMSFHGGLIGIIFIIFYFSIKYKKPFLVISDFIIPLIPFGLGAGRIGNFINCELWGRVAPQISHAMLFPCSQNEDLKIIHIDQTLKPLFDKYGMLPRYPSQLYEFFLEGVVLFIIIYLFDKKKQPIGRISGIFLTFYGIFRIITEFFREPDPQIGLLNNFITMGQILSIPMILIGIIIIVHSIYNKTLYGFKNK